MPTSTTAEYRYAIGTGATAASGGAHVIVAPAQRSFIATFAQASTRVTVPVTFTPTPRGMPTGSTAALSSHIPRIRSGYINALKDGKRLIRVNANGTFTEVLDPQNTLVSAG